MNFFVRFFTFGLLAGCYLSGFAQQSETPFSINGKLTVLNNKLCNKNGVPVQLRGLSTHGIQWYVWDRCITSESFSVLEEWGLDILRIALYIQDGGYEADPQGFTNQVVTLIEECSRRGLYVLVDWHQLTP